MKAAFEKVAIFTAPDLLLNLVDLQRGPRMNRWIHIRKIPFVRGDLPVRMHVPLAQHQQQLRLSKLRINERERHRVEGQIPGGEPRVFPFVRHRNNVGVVDMFPFVVAASLACGWRFRRARITAQPTAHVVAIKLLRPNHSRERLALHPLQIRACLGRGERFIKLIGFLNACLKNLIEIEAQRRLRCDVIREPQLDRSRRASGNGKVIPHADFRTRLQWIHRLLLAVDDVIVDAIFDVLRGIW